MKIKNTIENQTFDEERALYNLKNTEVRNCTFAGPQDGESVLKETRNVRVIDSKFSLRYPLWHAKTYELIHSTFDDKTRAPIWYADNGLIDNCDLKGIKLLRECNNTVIKNSNIVSPEFGWKCNNVTMENTKIISEYIFLDSKNVKLKNVEFQGNLAWFSDGLTLINCKIIGTQPLCYCNNLKLINCTMEDTDLAFEYSDVEADIKGNIISIKNPKSGTITVDSVGEIINEDSIMEVNGKVIIRSEL